VGGLLGVAVPVRAIGLVGGLLFLGFAAWTLRERDAEADSDDETNAVAKRGPAIDRRSIVLSVTGAMFVAELGDKTMLATATLAAQGNPVHTWVGATVGIILSGMLGVLLGRVFGARLPERVTRLGSGVLFAVFGTVLLVANL
jgi:Ca2+/H+ antiporter, TMEM165/GDT1 family